MARVIYGSIITDIKGSIGGITYQKNGSGTIARLKPRKNKTNTQKQRDQQPRLKTLQKEWNVLELGQKVLWNDFASVNDKIGLDGNPKKLTGYQWYLSINQNRLLFNDTILQEPPVFEVVNPINSITMDYTSGILRYYFDNSINISSYKLLVYSSFVINSVSKFNYESCRLVRKYQTDITLGYIVLESSTTKSWSEYYNSNFPPNLNNKPFYLIGYIRLISKVSGISSLAYTAIARFIWDGTKYVIE